MAYKVKVRDENHRCCCDGGTCAIFCSTRGGMATLVGVNEFSDPAHGINVSIPPKKYRFSGLSGATYVYDSFTGSCPVPGDDGTGRIRNTYSGFCRYDATTGLVVTNSGNNHQVVEGCYGTEDANLSVACGSGPIDQVRAPGHVVSTTVKTWYGIGCASGVCFISNLAYGDPGQIAMQTLGEEDTEADAIARIPGIDTWGPYVSCATLAVCCRTAWQLRGAGQFTLEYVESRIKVQGASSPNTHISVKVDLSRKPYGTGIPYSLYQTLEDDPTTAPDGSFSVDFGVLPNDVGWETIAGNCRVEVL